MGVMKRLHEQSQRVRNGQGPKGPSLAGRQIIRSTEKETDEFLKQFPTLLQNKVLRQAVRQAGRVVVKDARKRIRTKGRSIKTGTRKKWSRSLAAKRAITKTKDLYQSLTVKVVVYEESTVAMVGGRRPYGNHLNLLNKGWEMVWWGKPSGAYYIGLRGFWDQATTTTKAKQKQAMLHKIRSEWKKI